MIQYQLEKFPIDIGPLFFNFEKIAGACNIFSRLSKSCGIYSTAPKRKRRSYGIYSQLFENNAGVVEYIPQLLHYSLTCSSKS